MGSRIKLVLVILLVIVIYSGLLGHEAHALDTNGSEAGISKTSLKNKVVGKLAGGGGGGGRAFGGGGGGGGGRGFGGGGGQSGTPKGGSGSQGESGSGSRGGRIIPPLVGPGVLGTGNGGHNHRSNAASTVGSVTAIMFTAIVLGVAALACM